MCRKGTVSPNIQKAAYTYIRTLYIHTHMYAYAFMNKMYIVPHGHIHMSTCTLTQAHMFPG